MMDEQRFKQTEIGMIPEDWQISTIEKATERIIDYRGKTPRKTAYGIPLITAKIVKNGHILEPEEFISEKDYEAWMRRGTVREGDVIITTEAPMGEVAQLDERKVALAQRIITLRGKQNVLHNDFLRYVLQSPMLRNELRKRESGTTVTGIKQSELRKVQLPIPSYSEQEAIAKILFDLDSEIELNQQMNKTLESIGKAIFKHWFVDFEFPNGEGKPYKSSGGEMVYNEDLEKDIPKGWQVGPFSDVIEVNPKRELTTGEIATKVSMADLNPWQACIENWNHEEYKSGPKFKNEDTLFARITPSLENGKTALVSILNDAEVGFGSTEFIVFGKKAISSELYIFHLSRSQEIRKAAISAMTGTSGRQRVPDALFDHLPIILPPVTVLNQFEEACSSLFDQISNNAKQTKILSQIRNSLLPKLMSGKIRVPVEVR